MTGIQWRDSLMGWPSLTVKIELAPWHWRAAWYRDGIEPYYILKIGPVEVALNANRKPFHMERLQPVPGEREWGVRHTVDKWGEERNVKSVNRQTAEFIVSNCVGAGLSAALVFRRPDGEWERTQ